MSESLTYSYGEYTTGPIGIVENGVICRRATGYTGMVKMLSPLLDPKPKRILRSGPCTIVFWEDGTKTIVRKAPDEEDNAYAAFTAALAIKLFGSNQAVKRIVGMTETQEKKEKQGTANKELLKFLDDLLEKRRKEGVRPPKKEDGV